MTNSIKSSLRQLAKRQLPARKTQARRLITYTLTLALALLPSFHTVGQQSLVSEGVYKVEMIVLAHKTDNGIAIDEHWEQNIRTTYPSPVNLLRRNPEAEMVLGIEREDLDELAIPATGLLTKLPQTQRELNEMAMQMRLRKGYRLLFHEAWFQQFDGKSDSVSLLVEGGKWYDPYYELSGSITVSRNRFLHVATDLWLAEFVKLEQLAQTPWHARRKQLAYLDLPTRDKALGKNRHDSETPGSSPSNLRIDQNLEATLYEYSNAAVSGLGEYRAERVYALQEKRKIRTGELHYFDHPRLGILIKLTRLDQIESF